jgi:hypothetical protein
MQLLNLLVKNLDVHLPRLQGSATSGQLLLEILMSLDLSFGCFAPLVFLAVMNSGNSDRSG